MPWFKRFFDPIILPDRRKLLSLRDAATFIPVAIINNGGRSELQPIEVCRVPAWAI